MTFKETTVGLGTSSQLQNRYGDYASVNIDPADGCTFWVTGEYLPNGDNWHTHRRILPARLRQAS